MQIAFPFPRTCPESAGGPAVSQGYFISETMPNEELVKKNQEPEKADLVFRSFGEEWLSLCQRCRAVSKPAVFEITVCPCLQCILIGARLTAAKTAITTGRFVYL